MFDVERHLLPGERIRLVSRPHPVVLVRRLGKRLLQATMIGLVVRAVQSATVEAFLNLPFVRDLGGAAGPLPVADWVARGGLVFFLAVLAGATLDTLDFALTRYVLTDQRLLHLTGVLTRAIIDSPLDRINDVLLLQSLLGEKLDYGDFAVLRGEDTPNYMRALRGPRTFQRAMHAARLGKAPKRPGEPARTAAFSLGERS